MGGIYDICHRDGLRCHDLYTKFHTVLSLLFACCYILLHSTIIQPSTQQIYKKQINTVVLIYCDGFAQGITQQWSRGTPAGDVRQQ
jgi:hypothetical protein